MDFDVIVYLFIAFTVLSSLVKKFRERQRDNERDSMSRGLSGRMVSVPEPEVPEFELSEWDDFSEPEPGGRPVSASEFREVRGLRPVSEQDTGPEFQEVRGVRTISESYTGPEFRDPLADDDEEIVDRDRDAEVQKVSGEETLVSAPRKRPREKLRFNRDALVNAVLYKEILGTPRWEDMPW